MKICRHVVQDHSDLHHWLYAVPLVHFLTDQSRLFDKSVLVIDKPKQQQEDEWWGAQGFGTRAVRERIYYGGRFVFCWQLELKAALTVII